jgi:WD40 repeat protein
MSWLNDSVAVSGVVAISVLISPAAKSQSLSAEHPGPQYDDRQHSQQLSSFFIASDLPHRTQQVPIPPEASPTVENAPSLLREMVVPDTRIIRAVAISPDGQTIVTGNDNDEVQFWDLATGQLLTSASGNSQQVQAVAFSPNGQTLVSGSVVPGQLQTWPWQHRLEPDMVRPVPNVYSVAISPDGSILATGHSGGVINLWTQDLELIGSIPAYTPAPGRPANVVAVAFSPAGDRLASRAAIVPDGSNSVKLWNLETGAMEASLEGDASGGVNSIAYSPDGAMLAGYYDGVYSAGIVRLWDGNSGAVLADLESGVVRPHAVAFSPDGNLLAVAGLNDLIEIWDLNNRTVTHTFSTGRILNHVYALAFSPDGQTLVTAGAATLPDSAGGGKGGSIMVWAVP